MYIEPRLLEPSNDIIIIIIIIIIIMYIVFRYTHNHL